jgi:predicted transcriptional regulator
MLKELKSQHRNIIQMAFNGYKNQEIAERLGMAQSSVSIILRSPLGQAYLNGLQDRAHEAILDVRKKLVSLNKSALDTFTHLLNASSRKAVPASVQFNAAKDVLDRNGYKAPDRLNIDMTLQTKTDEELDAEIAAIEEAINRTSGKNLPEIKKSLKQNLSFTTIPLESCQAVVATSTNEDDLSLEDFPSDEQELFKEFDNESFEEPSFVEDPSILEDLSFDPFHNIKRS